jgi:hypothetical protein
MTTTPLEVLVRARERLSRPENWIKGEGTYCFCSRGLIATAPSAGAYLAR